MRTRSAGDRGVVTSCRVQTSAGSDLGKWFPRLAPAVVAVGLAGSLFSGVAAAQPPLKPPVEAPANFAELGSSLAGSYFVAAPLKERYDRLLGQLETLKREMDDQRLTGPQAAGRVATLREELRTLRLEIERSKIEVPAAKVHSVTETTALELGPERYLVITADQVRLLPSEDARVHCVLEKICLSADDQPATAELTAIKLVHRHGAAPEIVGKTEQEWAEEEARFARDEAGQQHTAAALAGRKQLVDSIRQSFTLYRDLQGKAIDTLTVSGLTFEQGNRQITLEVQSRGSGGSVRSEWRRRARLTVRVPACKRVFVRGSLRGLDVEGSPAPLTVAGAGARDRDYQAQFRIRGVHGDVVVDQFPVNQIEDIDGSVTIDSVPDFANSGTQHAGGMRQSFLYRPLDCRIANVSGNLRAHFGRVSLTVEGVGGRLDVRNDFGDTALVVARPLAAAAHRVTSVGGRIEATVQRPAVKDRSVFLGTSYGTIRTNTTQQEYPDYSFGGSQAWHGFRHTPGAAGTDILGSLEVLEGKRQDPGLVLVSRAGAVVFTLNPPR